MPSEHMMVFSFVTIMHSISSREFIREMPSLIPSEKIEVDNASPSTE